ncbi:MAG: homocysteine S-methyltransferase [Gemmatimonadetes bacterium]|nr:homocysteine S-methyltransferase [Gemmatimonadota bacterium]
MTVLDGGLATYLETLGYDLADDLWSAKVLLEDPDAIRRAHTDFLLAGSDCITAVTYQASIPGFVARGLTYEGAVEVLERAVTIAVEARDVFWSDTRNRGQRLRPLVAASVGPYGAYRADGSEYTGEYSLSDGELMGFHEGRWRILAESAADLLACETIPSLQEAEVLLELLRRTPDRWAWMSFSCRDGAHLSDGSPLAEAAGICGAVPGVAAVGINCTRPEFVVELISVVRNSTEKPIIVYPNAGGRYDAERKSWEGDPPQHDWPALVGKWRDLGATVIGGCCRVGPEDTSLMRGRLLPSGGPP